MPALVAIKQTESTFRKLYERVSTKSGVKMKGIVTVQKKLLVMIYHIWKNGLIYDPNFKSIPKEEQAPTSRVPLKKPIKENAMMMEENTTNEMSKKLAITSMAKQGKRSVNDHSSPPFGRVKVLKKERNS